MAKYMSVRVRIVDDKGECPKVKHEWWDGRYTGVYGEAGSERYVTFDEADIVEVDGE